MATYEEIEARLTAPGAPFEIAVEEVRGLPMKNFRNRERSLREKVAAAAMRGDAEFLVQGERRISFRRFARLCWGAARSLREQFGLAPGDRIAIYATNSPDWLVALFGATSAGAIGVGLNGWWKAEEVRYALGDCGARYLVVDERLWPRIESVVRDADAVERVFFIGAHPPRRTVPIAELLVEEDAPPEVPIDEDDPWVILYTSGTTGRPKGCITTHRGTVTQVLGILYANVAGALLGVAPPALTGGGPPVMLLTSPLFHVAGLHSTFCTALSTGAKLVFTEGRFDPVQVMQLIERERVTAWGAVPTMLHRVVHHPDVEKYDLSSLRSISFGGAPTPPETIERARRVLPVEPTLTNAYGLTETHGVATVAGGRELLGKRTAAGRPLPVLEIAIVDEGRRPLPRGAGGEIAIYGPTVTPGYWGIERPDNLEAGWLYTGDRGFVDEDGFLFVVDRIKDLIIRGGENVSCVEIENVLAEHPEIDEAAVVGVPDPELGERVKAVVRRVPGSTLSAEAVREHARRHLAEFKVPEIVEFTDRPLPRNPAGKILKNLLRGRGEVPFEVEELDGFEGGR